MSLNENVATAMNFSTLSGIICGLAFIITAISRGGELVLFFNLNAALLTIGGTMAATFIAFPFSRIVNLSRTLAHAFRTDIHPPSNYVSSITNIGRAYRRGGLRKLELEMEGLENPYLKSAADLLVENMPREQIALILENERLYLSIRHESGEMILKTMAKFAPAFGMVGTLIGLVQMFAGLSDPSRIGPPMAVALLTTFYGMLISYLFFLPLASKLRSRTDDELLLMKVIQEGILLVEKSENPRRVRRILFSMLPPEKRLEEK